MHLFFFFTQLIDDLTQLLPPKHLEEVTSKCHRVNVLRGAVAHIKFLSDHNALLNNSLDVAKGQGFSVSKVVDETLAESTTEATGTPVKVNDEDDDIMLMDVDPTEAVKQEESNGNDAERVARSEEAYSMSKSRLVSASPKPTTIVTQPSVIITNSPSPSSSDKGAGTSKATLAPPPISIITAPVDTHSHASQHMRNRSMSECASPSGSFSSSPMFPPTTHMAPSATTPSAFPPSPVSPSPSARQNPFSLTVSHAEGTNELKNDQQHQLSPFMQPRSRTPSPSLPPISSLANLQLQSPSGGDTLGEQRLSHRQSSPSLRLNASSSSSSGTGPAASSSSSHSKSGSHRSGPALPPLKIPAQHHLHPSYHNQDHAGVKSSRRNSHGALSPHHSTTMPGYYQRPLEDQLPVSPFMLSPMMSRSPSMGPQSDSASITLPYPHWGGHERSDVLPPPPPPPHLGHYMPGPLSPHAYPHGYPYPYPYHPSYGYPPHPHAPPPPPHYAHHPPYPHSPQQPPQQAASSSQASATARSQQPEPIFIQEEPWNVQRKRGALHASSSSGSSKTGSAGVTATVAVHSQKPKLSSGKMGEQDDALTDEPPLSPSLSVASSLSLNQRKRTSSYKSNLDGEEEDGSGEGMDVESKAFSSSVKRMKQHDNGDNIDDGDDGKQNSGKVVVVVVEADGKQRANETKDDADVAKALTPFTKTGV
ncbi:hypothetical protein BGZ99_004420 [Dissophora globulifera]|uniref:Uncharacterized protein n=1 Tax=Dissophora globulifera TaxID=979702 RepID=A0A9P6UV37_9FUNG|nr:hypothetical protein BGZ99_004420 [Dissophora globulifera]